MDLFILAGEASGDLHGARLIEALLKENPDLHIGAVAGPRMRALPIEPHFEMEKLQVMGFIDVIGAIPHLIRQFLAIRNKILALQPKAVVCIDYPGFNLRLEKSLRKKGYTGKLIHYICPSVWAHGKNRIPQMENRLDLLLTIFPFEKRYFSEKLDVRYVGHPLIEAIRSFTYAPFSSSKILSIFPGSREKEVERNFLMQLRVAQKLIQIDPRLQIAVSISHKMRESQLRALAKDVPVLFVPPERNYDLMKASHLALAKSGTVTLELALHRTPTIVSFAMPAIDIWFAQKILKINLPFYCIANIVASKRVFPELIGPHLREEQLFFSAKSLCFDEGEREACRRGCDEVRTLLEEGASSDGAARAILQVAQ